MIDSQHVQNVAAAIVAIVYGMAGICLLVYTDRIKKQLDRHEEDNKRHRAEDLAKRGYGNESTHKSDPTQPLLGVVSPKTRDQDFKDMIL